MEHYVLTFLGNGSGIESASILASGLSYDPYGGNKQQLRTCQVAYTVSFTEEAHIGSTQDFSGSVGLGGERCGVLCALVVRSGGKCD